MQTLIFARVFPVTEILVFRYIFLRSQDNSRCDWIGSIQRWGELPQKQENTLTFPLSLMLKFLIKVLPPTYRYFHINHTVGNLHFFTVVTDITYRNGKSKCPVYIGQQYSWLQNESWHLYWETVESCKIKRWRSVAFPQSCDHHC